jgi:hypothetical protein
MRYDRRPAHAWRSGGRFRVAAEEALLMPPIALLNRGVIAAEIAMDARIGTGWGSAGVSLYADAGNCWQLLLVEGPDGRRYFELMEILGGHRHANAAPGSVTQLPVQESGDLSTWEPAKRYRLTLEVSPDHIVGEVGPADGGPVWRREYTLAGRRAVREGRPAVFASGADGRVSLFTVARAPQADANALALRSGPRGSVAILKARRGGIAGQLGKALEQAGFGVTLVGWDDHRSRRLPQSKLDLLILADAREIPVQARDAVERLLSSGGRLIAIGAPAAAKILAPVDRTWADRDAWVEAQARKLLRTPLTLTESDWRRTAFRPAQAASIRHDPASGPGVWRIETDLEGWDGWAAETPGAFGSERSLLVFEARGDAVTTQLAVECVEQDGSRWIGVIPLTTAWKTYVLRPEDLMYWLDSPAKGRGGPEDRFAPGRMARLSFTLSASHTPAVKPGHHTYWIRGLSTAGDAATESPRFTVSDVEALWPSYKLYPMDHIATLRAAGEQGVVDAAIRASWSRPGYAPVWRERGRGFDRGRAWRYVPILEAFDSTGRRRGALLSLMIGDAASPNAMWANLSVADPADALKSPVLDALLATAKAMVHGVCLLEGGAELFSYKPGETVHLGIKALNAGKHPVRLEARIQVTGPRGRKAFAGVRPLSVAPGMAAKATWNWRPAVWDPSGYTVTATISESGRIVDRIAHRIETLRTAPARPEEFVRVRGSEFILDGKPWHFRGINYWPTSIGGYPNLNQRSREGYDPEIIERDLNWLQKAGVNALSAIAAVVPPDPDDPRGYRDQLDFLERCYRRGIRCYVTLPYGRAYAGADFARLKEYIEKAGLHNHPVVMCWELAWEPIEGPWGGNLDRFLEPWNRWIAEQYGSIENAVRDWAYDPRPSPSEPVPTPTSAQCTTDGPWNRYVAAFARAHSDLIGRAYGEVVRPLRAWDPNHLISFRGGACGIPSGATFAHIHSVGVARHMDFLCPEGYNLQTAGWANPTPPDDIRKGGLMTLYYRHVSREKPVVWMEFGYTANGFGGAWSPERVRLKPEDLERQRAEIERFYAMIIESGARGAAPWWLPGGFRLGENSDFGILEPDGSERPAARVFRACQPRFADVRHPAPDSIIRMDLDGERWHAWEIYAPKYLDLVKAGHVPALASAGTNTTSANCPLIAVGGTPCNGSNPPLYLNAEFDAIELQIGGVWRTVHDGDVIEAPAGQAVRCRARIGNVAEALWLAPNGASAGGAYLLSHVGGSPSPVRSPIAADTPYLGAAEIAEFELLASVTGRTAVSFRMEAAGRTPFGERRRVEIVPR